MNTEIQNVTEEYTAAHYDWFTLHNIPKSAIGWLSILDKLFLDSMLIKIRSERIAYNSSSMKNKTMQEKEHNLEKSIKEIEIKEKEREKKTRYYIF